MTLTETATITEREPVIDDRARERCAGKITIRETISSIRTAYQTHVETFKQHWNQQRPRTKLLYYAGLIFLLNFAPGTILPSGRLTAKDADANQYMKMLSGGVSNGALSFAVSTLKRDDGIALHVSASALALASILGHLLHPGIYIELYKILKHQPVCCMVCHGPHLCHRSCPHLMAHACYTQMNPDCIHYFADIGYCHARSGITAQDAAQHCANSNGACEEHMQQVNVDRCIARKLARGYYHRCRNGTEEAWRKIVFDEAILPCHKCYGLEGQKFKDSNGMNQTVFSWMEPAFCDYRAVL